MGDELKKKEYNYLILMLKNKKVISTVYKVINSNGIQSEKLTTSKLFFVKNKDETIEIR